MWTPDSELRPWLDELRAALGPLDLHDAHTHVGQNDPDGERQTPAELLEQLAGAGARGVVFPMHEPDGYRGPNDAVLAAAAESGGRLTAFCRVDPRGSALAEATRCLDAGARGIKLHPRAERFGMDEPAVRELVALAHERRVPILIHAGRGIPALGVNTVEYAREFPEARFILAHAAVSDLAWLWRLLPELPNVLIDTAWWLPADIMALFTLAPPANIVWASDAPYGSPVTAAVIAIRCMLQAGLEVDAIRVICAGQLDRVLAGDELLRLGPAPGAPKPLHPALERVVSQLVAAVTCLFSGGSHVEMLALATLACDPADPEVGEVCQRVLGLLEAFERHYEPGATVRSPALAMLVAAAIVARTPDAPLPAL